MIYAEQAIFSTRLADPASGYQLLGRSEGVSDAEARDLAAWDPVQDLWDQPGPTARSVSFHGLPSGNYCVAQTILLGAEGGSGRARAYTHCLLVSPSGLARFNNNPFTLLRAATSASPLPVYRDVPPRMERLPLAGRWAAVDQMLLARLAVSIGPRWLGALVQAASESSCLILAGSTATEPLLAGLMSCLPLECRADFSFTTNGALATRRTLRVVGCPGPVAAVRAGLPCHNLAILDLAAPPPEEFAQTDGWGRLIERVLACGRTAFLATQLSKRRFALSTADLPVLALQLLENLDASALGSEPAQRPLDAAAAPAESAEALEAPAEEQARVQRAHAAHAAPSPLDPRLAEAPVAKPPGPSRCLAPDSSEVLEKLEQLDDAVFEAIGGKPEGLDLLRSLWPAVRCELGDDLLAESREQYLRYALSIWEECVVSNGLRNPDKAVQALDVLCVLFDRL